MIRLRMARRARGRWRRNKVLWWSIKHLVLYSMPSQYLLIFSFSLRIRTIPNNKSDDETSRLVYLVCPTAGFKLGLAGERMWISARMAVKRSGRPIPRLLKILSLEFSEVSVGASGRESVHKRFCRRRTKHTKQERRVDSATRAGEGIEGQSAKCWRRRRRKRMEGRPGPMLSWRRNPNLRRQNVQFYISLFFNSDITCFLSYGLSPRR